MKLASKASLELTATGVRILVASTEIGQGTRTMHAQIVADTLKHPLRRRGGGSSRYESCARQRSDRRVANLHDRGRPAPTRGAADADALGGATPANYFRKHGPLVITTQYERPPGLEWDDDRYRGDAYGSYGWGCNVVELEIDQATWEVRTSKVTAVVEIGKAIHPAMAIGQVEGGTAQGIGYALLEDVVMREGRMANATLTNYIIPTPPDTPPIDTVLLERPYKHGPFGAKGVGEMPIDGPAPAVVNAIRHAGYRCARDSVTPERLMTAARLSPRARRGRPR